MKLTPEKIKEQQMMWIDDYYHHVETGAPMPEWEYQHTPTRWHSMKIDCDPVFILRTTACRRKQQAEIQEQP